jgi:Domain of unknown function (DUF4397)
MYLNNVLKFSRLTVLAISLTTAFTACKEDEEEVTPTPAPVVVETPKANVLVVHASPDAPGVGLLVDDVLINTGAALEYPNNTGYLAVDAGTRNIKVNVFGTASTVIEADLPLEENVNYTVFAKDEVANISPLVLVDDLTAPAAGKAHIRFVHLSPNAPAVDVLADGSPLFSNYVFTDASSFTPVDAGSYLISVNAAGTETEVLNVGSVSLEAGKIYTVFAKGFYEATAEQPELGAQIIVNN